jgi:Glycosyl hydrolase family 26
MTLEQTLTPVRSSDSSADRQSSRSTDLSQNIWSSMRNDEGGTGQPASNGGERWGAPEARNHGSGGMSHDGKALQFGDNKEMQKLYGDFSDLLSGANQTMTAMQALQPELNGLTTEVNTIEQQIAQLENGILPMPPAAGGADLGTIAPVTTGDGAVTPSVVTGESGAVASPVVTGESGAVAQPVVTGEGGAVAQPMVTGESGAVTPPVVTGDGVAVTTPVVTGNSGAATPAVTGDGGAGTVVSDTPPPAVSDTPSPAVSDAPSPVVSDAPPPAVSQPVTATPAGSTSISGLNHAVAFYNSDAEPNGVEQMAQTLNGPVTMATYLSSAPDGQNIATANTWIMPTLQAAEQQNPSEPPIVAVPLVQSNGDTLANAAAGGDNAAFTQLAQEMVSAGAGNSVLRLGWESNGNWFPWSADQNPQQYVQAFDNAVTAMRSVPGANFTFDWNVSAGPANWPAGDTLSTFYPGNAYVDDIGVDAYDNQNWNDLLNGSNGLNAVQQFASQNGKPMSVDEWGLWSSSSGGQGDDPTFINNMANFFANTPNLAFQGYFNDTMPGGSEDLADNPNSQAAYIQDFQGQ